MAGVPGSPGPLRTATPTPLRAGGASVREGVWQSGGVDDAQLSLAAAPPSWLHKATKGL